MKSYVRKKLHDKPENVPYTNSHMRYRHYGKLLELMLQKWQEMPEGEEKDQLIVYLANHMKKIAYGMEQRSRRRREDIERHS